jgi:glucose 1-dehydrogenase
MFKSNMLEGETVLVTGSSQGIGVGVAEACSRHGAQVVLTSQHPRAKLSSEALVVLTRPGTHYVECDVMKDGEIARLLAEAWKQFGTVSVLINNVGTYKEPPFGKITRADFDMINGLNAWVPLEASQQFVERRKKEGRGGRIVFSGSLNGTRSEPDHVLYDGSKGNVGALARQIAVEQGRFGFTTAVVAPGLIETPLTDMGLRSDPAGRKAIEDQIPVGRIGTVADVAEIYAFFASRYAAYMTGVSVPVDGGLDAQQMPVRPIAEAERQ